MKSSIEIRNEVRALDDKVLDAEHRFNSAEGDVKDAIRDEIMGYKGEIKALNSMLDDVLAEEDKIRKGGGVPLAAEPKAEKKVKSLAEMLMGARDEFKGLEMVKAGMKLDVMDAAPDYGLPGIEKVDLNLPRQTYEYMPNFGFLDSLPTGTTDATIVKYFEADPEAYTNSAATWKSGNKKPTSEMGWTQKSAMVETIAHLMPVLEENLQDYGQLRSIIDNELMMGLRLVKAQKALNGDNSNGITGVLKNASIQKYTKVAKDTLPDAIRKMKTDSFLNSNFMPTHIAVHPYVAENLELQKDANGRYMNVMVNGRLWALRVVEDLNLVSGSVGQEKYGVLVYWNGAATWLTRSTDSLAVGLVGEQFAYNEISIRAEGRHALKVTYPKSFVYLADAGITR
jgi:HK97 family phage major capsid protein